MGALGVYWIVQNPDILHALNPYYAFTFFIHHGMVGLIVLGAVFLAVTGAEALYADLGHFGRTPIQRAWLFLVFPSLSLNYLGQGALVRLHPEAIDNRDCAGRAAGGPCDPAAWLAPALRGCAGDAADG
jgi:KUP system potassium uptake protein